jgi:hypothetical protein
MNQILERFSAGNLPQIQLTGFLLCLGVSVVAALIAEGMYLLFYSNRATGAQIHRSFILIGPAITLLFVCIQLSLPLSLGLLGALSIIRFRTPIKEPEEVGFIMLVVAAAVASATFNFLFLALLFAVTFLVLAARQWLPFRPMGRERREGVLLISLPDEAYQASGATLAPVLGRYFKSVRLESVTSVEGLTSVQYVFHGARTDNWAELQREVKAAAPVTRVNAFFSRSGGLR